MRLTVKFRNIESSDEIHELVERRVRFALGRFGDHIQRTDVVLTDVNGPRGGTDQHCTLTVILPSASPTVIEVTDIEIMAAVGRAAERAARHVRDNLKRRRDLQRHYGAARLRSVG